jgi:hypothetical protein
LERLPNIYAHKDTFWRQAELAAARKTSAGYDEASRLLVELRDAAAQFNQSPEFQARFQAWVLPHLSRPALIRRLRERDLPLPK